MSGFLFLKISISHYGLKESANFEKLTIHSTKLARLGVNPILLEKGHFCPLLVFS